VNELLSARRLASGGDPGRLVYSSWFGDLGGGELRMLDHIRATAFLPERTMVLVNQPGRLLDVLREMGVIVELVRWHSGASFLARQLHWYWAKVWTWRRLRTFRPDLVVSNTFFDFETTGRVAAALRLPLIWRARADTFPTAHLWPPGRLRELVSLLNGRVDRILATTAYEAALMVDAGVDRAKVVVVRNGVDLNRYAAQEKGRSLRRELGLTPADFCAAFVARMVPQKGYETFFEAIARVKARGTRVNALIAGDTTLLEDSPDDYRQSLRDLVARLNIADRVHFLGFRDDVEAVMQAADVFVLASLKEPFGTTVVEAMASARPVISSDLPGPRESLVEGETGLFFPAGDAEALADRLVQIHGDPELRRVLGSAGRSRAEAEFDLDRNIRTLDQHCLDVVRSHGRRRG
jgi:glycosyltransferase involved in cell wall biosynthesis